MRLIEIKKWFKEAEIFPLNGADVEIEALVADSRETTKNGLFFCLEGENADGHNYVAEAVKNGAVAAVCRRALPIALPQLIVSDVREALALISAYFYGNPSNDLKIIGITGTNGKTTTSYMLASILEKAGKKVGVIGTLGIRYLGVRQNTDLTTPDPIFLQKTLSEMVAHGVEYVVMEVSAHAIYYKKTQGITFSACIFTNCTQDHLDFFQTMQRYQAVKKSLFGVSCPLAIVNGDDETGREIGASRELTNAKTIFYGLQTPADAFAVITNESLRKTECMLNVDDKLCRVTLHMMGKHNVYNALAAATCAFSLGVSPTAVSDGLTGIEAVSGRLEWIAQVNGADIFVDFAHTSDGLEKSLEALRAHCKGKLVCLFGCGGNRDKEKRPIMGEIAAKNADFCVLTSDNPRYEDPLDILVDIENGYRRYSLKYVIVPDRKRGIEYAIAYLKRGDVLVIAGKGGETYQEIMGIKYPFKDNDIVEKFVRSMRKNTQLC